MQGKFEELKKVSHDYKPEELADMLTFDEGIKMACKMVSNDDRDETLKKYATKFLEKLRQKYPKEWNATWKYDAFLGSIYYRIMEYDKRYESYKRAFEKANPPPPELLIAMAGCCRCPGKPPVTEQEAISLAKQAMSDTYYYEGALLLRGLCRSIGDTEEQNYWDNVLEEMKGKETHLPRLDEICEDYS